MFEKKNNKDALGNDLNNDNILKVKSSKDEFEDKGEFSDNSKENMQALTVKYNEIDVTKHLKPIYYYECENCKKIHRSQIDVCPDCGSRFLKPLYTGMKYCYIDNANKRLTPRYNQILANQRKHEYGTNQSLVGDLILAFCIIMCFVALIGSQVIISKFTNDLHASARISLLIFSCLLLLFGYLVFKKYGNDVQKEVKENIIPKRYKFIKDCKYTLEDKDSDISRMIVDYYTDNGNKVILKSHRYISPYQGFDDKVDLIINPDNLKDYNIDFNLDQKLKHK